ncbi:uncharacterized protein LOC119674826 [Teleopsis dalmanni]|uniref:uncharacterized protein LOC119674826 n=1 Tax=Teleopsis dalmanni TaxID=139649 RepID=UPI0018CFB721|nr:uncharacterized protein LOC119674826 [Teleopsis dalmanni]
MVYNILFCSTIFCSIFLYIMSGIRYIAYACALWHVVVAIGDEYAKYETRKQARRWAIDGLNVGMLRNARLHGGDNHGNSTAALLSMIRELPPEQESEHDHILSAL